MSWENRTFGHPIINENLARTCQRPKFCECSLLAESVLFEKDKWKFPHDFNE